LRSKTGYFKDRTLQPTYDKNFIYNGHV